MPIRRSSLLAFMALIAAGTSWSQAAAAAPAPETKGPWLGQAIPGDTPVPFAPAVFKSLSVWVETIDFSPDGNTCLISVGSPRYTSSKLYLSTMENGAWTAFAEAPFVNGFSYSNEPVFSYDGSSLMFTGVKGGSKDLWTVGHKDGKWGQPVALPAPINSDAAEFRGCYAKDGSMYFCSERSGTMAVYTARMDSSGVPAVSLVGPPISMGAIEGDPCIAQDGSYLIFHSCKDMKSSNLFVSFKDAAGAWGPPINLGSKYNTGNDEYGSHLSTDGRFYFFTRHGPTGNTIFWVSVSAIERLRPGL